MSQSSDLSPAEPPAVPSNEYERFLAALPESLRDECRSRLSGSGLSPDHPVFQLLADVYEKAPRAGGHAPDFLEEARLHADRSKQILTDFADLPEVILSRIEPTILAAVSALNSPIQRLESTATHLQRNVEALPVLLLSNRTATGPRPSIWWKIPCWWLGNFIRTGSVVFSNHLASLVTGCISLCLALAVLILGANQLSDYYEAAFQQRLSHLEADSVQNTIALNRLLAAGISLKVERDADAHSYFLILQGAQKAANPISSPEGLAVQIWP